MKGGTKGKYNNLKTVMELVIIFKKIVQINIKAILNI
jgi:hypothetical protein